MDSLLNVWLYVETLKLQEMRLVTMEMMKIKMDAHLHAKLKKDGPVKDLNAQLFVMMESSQRMKNVTMGIKNQMMAVPLNV